MPATSKSQQRLFSMALAVRKGDLPRSKVWKAVLDIVDSDMSNKEIEDFTVLKEGMTPLSTYVVEALKKLGSGEEGTVYDIGDGRIKKVFKRGNVPLAYQLLKAATDYGVIQCLLKVFEVGDDYIIRENCKPRTSKCKKYFDTLQAIPFENSNDNLYWMIMNDTWYWDPDKECVKSKIRMATTKIQTEVIEWATRLKYELSQICGERAGLGDFGLKNLGETNDGRVVLMDF